MRIWLNEVLSNQGFDGLVWVNQAGLVDICTAHVLSGPFECAHEAPLLQSAPLLG